MFAHDLVVYITSLEGGGAERAMIELTSGLQSRGYETTIVCNRAGDEYSDLVERRGVRVLELGLGTTPLDSLRALPRLRRVLGRLRPRAVLSTLTRPNLAILTLGRTIRPRPRLVVRVPGIIDPSRQSAPIVAAMRLLYASAEGVVCVSQGAAGDLAKHGIRPRSVRVITNSVDHRALRRAARGPWPSTVPRFEGRTLLAMGRLAPVKGFDVLLRALPALPQDVRLVILGDGDSRADLEQLAAELGVGDRVSMPGFVKDPFPVLARASAFILPSRQEGMPNALIQALSLGVPAVAADAPGGIREVLRDGQVGWLAPPEDPSTLATTIERALEHPEERTATSDWHELFDHERSVDRYEAVLFGKSAECASFERGNGFD